MVRLGFVGAPGRTRTSTTLRPPDFESGASTNSATGANRARIIAAQDRGSTIVEAAFDGNHRQAVRRAVSQRHAGTFRRSSRIVRLVALSREPRHDGGADCCARRRGNNSGRLVLSTGHRAQAVPDVPRAALAVLHRHSACVDRGIRGLAQGTARHCGCRAAGARGADDLERLHGRVPFRR